MEEISGVRAVRERNDFIERGHRARIENRLRAIHGRSENARHVVEIKASSKHGLFRIGSAPFVLPEAMTDAGREPVAHYTLYECR